MRADFSEANPTDIKRDRLRFRVERDQGSYNWFEVLVFVNDVEMTSVGAGKGMDPYDLLVPTNRLVATTVGHSVPFARCQSCGDRTCDSTDVTITRDGPVVHWDWSGRTVPMDRRVTFDAQEYDAEVARVGRDHSWETPDRVTARRVLERLDLEQLRRHGLTIETVVERSRDGDSFEIWFDHGDRYQVFARFPWAQQSSEELVELVVSALSQHPAMWTATWHSTEDTEMPSPPAIAGSSWSEEPF